MKTPTNAAGYYYQSIEKHQQRAYETSLELINQAIDLDNSQVSYYCQRGVVWQELQNFSAAIQDFDAVISWKVEEEQQPYKRPFAVKALLGRVKAYYQQKKYEEMLKDCTHLLQCERNNWQAFFYRALGLYFLQRYKQAYADIEMAAYLSNEPDKMCMYHGMICFKLEKYTQAQRDFETALHYKPSEAVLWYNQGLNFYKLERFKEAIASYDEATKLGMTNTQLPASRAQAVMRLTLSE